MSNDEGRKHHPCMCSWNSKATGIILGSRQCNGGWPNNQNGRNQSYRAMVQEYCGSPGNIMDTFRTERVKTKLLPLVQDWPGQSGPLNTVMIEPAVKS